MTAKTREDVKVSPQKVLGMLWLCSLFVYLCIGSTTFIGGTQCLIGVVCAIAGILWIASSVMLVAIFVKTALPSRSNAPDASRSSIVRWFASVAGGLLGGVAAQTVNHLFPGRWTNHANLLADLVIFGLVGMLFGVIPLVFSLKARTSAILALILSSALTWLIVASSFR